MGLLLIGDEIVFYNKKLNDRFINILRAQKEQQNKIGLLEHILDRFQNLYLLHSVGVLEIQSESDVTMASAGFVDPWI